MSIKHELVTVDYTHGQPREYSSGLVLIALRCLKAYAYLFIYFPLQRCSPTEAGSHIFSLLPMSAASPATTLLIIWFFAEKLLKQLELKGTTKGMNKHQCAG